MSEEQAPRLSEGRRRSSILQFFTGGSSRVDECAWKVGGRYEVLKNASLYAEQTLDGNPVSYVKAKQTVLMLRFLNADQSRRGIPVGFVLPSEAREAGWMQLQGDTTDPKKFFLWRQRLEGSWEMRARYRVKHPATLRQEEDLKSDVVCEVHPGSEVLVLQTGLYLGGDDQRTRLRLQVSTDNAQIGWLSPQTGKGDNLLDPVNLLGKDMLRIHQSSVRNNSVNAGVIRQMSQSGLLDADKMTLEQLPWEVGAQYRVLEKIPLRDASNVTSKQICKIPAGEIVAVAEMANAPCPNLGKCPVAFVHVISGKLKGKSGWVRCAAKDGRDLIDVRDQLEYEKIQAKIRMAAQQEAERKAKAEQERRARAEQERLEKESRGIAATSVARPASPERDADASEAETEEFEEDSEEETEASETDGAEDHEASDDESEEQEPAEKALPEAAGPPGRPPVGMLDGMREPKMPMGIERLAPDVNKDNGKEREWVRKLQDLEVGGKEEKMVDDKTAIVDERQCCSCNCAAPRTEAKKAN